MTDRRKAILFDNAMRWVCEHTIEFGNEEYAYALQNIGFTDDEAMDEMEYEKNCISAVWNVYHPEETVDYAKLSYLVYLYKKRTHHFMGENVSWNDEDEESYKDHLKYARQIILIAQYWNDEEVIGFIADHLEREED